MEEQIEKHLEQVSGIIDDVGRALSVAAEEQVRNDPKIQTVLMDEDAEAIVHEAKKKAEAKVEELISTIDALILEEREMCAKVVEVMVNQFEACETGGKSSARDFMSKVADRIRARPDLSVAP